MRHVDDFPHRVLEDPHVPIAMPDGCTLSARLWRPATALERPVPAILEYLPYRKRDGTVERDELTHPWFAGHGYACLRVDLRGSGESGGLMHDEYARQELDDALATIAWIAAQPWCDGSVGMMGISWGGFNALQVAALRPPALKAIVTLCSSADRFADDIHYKGGCLLGENVGWAANMLSYSSRPPDPALVGDAYLPMWLERLERMPLLASPWLRHQRRDAYWRHGSVCEDYAAITAATLSFGGWHDGYRNTVARLVEHLDAPVKGIVGPWIHKYPHFAAPAPAIGFLQEAKRWWDRWLSGVDTGVERDPAYRVWLMDAVEPARWLPERPGRWIGEREWPSPGIVERVLHLGEGVLGDAPSAFTALVDSPMDCGETAGEYFPFAFGPELPAEQSRDDARSVRFDTAPQGAAADIVGAPTLELSLSADRPLAQVVARLCDVAPDGTSALVTLGLLNLAHRDSAEDPAPLVPGERVDVRVVLDQIAYRLPAGHRLRIALSTVCWPFAWPSPERAALTVDAGALRLPLRTGDEGPEVGFEPPEGAPARRTESLRPSSSTRETVRDAATGETVTLIVNDFGAGRDLEHGLRAGSATTERWRIHPDDPTSARVDIEWEQTGGRGDWDWCTRSVTTLRCDRDAFRVTATLVAIENGATLFERRWEEAIPREFV